MTSALVFLTVNQYRPSGNRTYSESFGFPAKLALKVIIKLLLCHGNFSFNFIIR